ncbi:HGGxSTG domain-containing protein [Peribacillus sp. NPDC097895]|uniref:HGGxSTG domain-containing protein n=1 Tax=Peribacillus sp. NPDC097895 TaxID=3390619 RepID=UPI003CFBCD23
MGNKRSKLPKELRELIAQTEGETNEDAVKILKSKLKKEPSICGAKQGNGSICVRSPHIKEDGSTNGRCKTHGGNSTGQKTEEGRRNSMKNLNSKAALIHGIYSQNFKDQLTKEEVEFYNETVEWFLEGNEIDPVNLAMLDRYIFNFIKQARKDSADFLSESPSYNDFEVKMVRLAESLGLNRKFTLSKENKDNASILSLTDLFMDNEEDN